LTHLSLAQEISDDYKKAVKKMLEVSGSQAIFKASVSQMMDIMKKQYSSVPDKVWSEFITEMEKTSMEDLIVLLIPIYHKHFTLEDIKQLIDFYQSPVGKKFAEKTPLITQESMQAGYDWGLQIGQKIAEKLKEKGY
jgi:hypothetical protein